MKLKMFVAVSLAFAITASLNAQKKVFTEVGNEISTTTRSIVQDGNVIGYLLFTQLERVSSDSFSYVIKVLDENLNDIGKVEFNDQNLKLQSVTYQNDLIHMAFFKTNLKYEKKSKDLKEIVNNEKSFIQIKSINLEGKIIYNYQKPLNIKESVKNISIYNFNLALLKSPIQLSANGNNGLIASYKDDDNYEILSLNSKLELVWNKKLNYDGLYNYVLLTAKNCNIISEKVDFNVKQTFLTVFELETGKEILKKQNVVDKKTNLYLNILGIEKDPKSGDLVIMGKTYVEGRNKFKHTVNEVKRGALTAFGTIIYNDNNPKEKKEIFTYLRSENGGSTAETLDEKGRLAALGDYPFINTAYRDFNGNTLFVGNGVRYTLKYGAIASSLFLFGAGNATSAGLNFGSLVLPGLISLGGYSKCKFTDGIIIKQDTKNKLSLQSNTKLHETGYMNTRILIAGSQSGEITRQFIPFKNQTSKTNYVIYDDNKNYTILNVTTNKVLKVIPQKENKTEIEIVPAKEGHIMIIENNKKAKTITLSIESLG